MAFCANNARIYGIDAKFYGKGIDIKLFFN
jgi:hypothetical protein